MFHKITAFGMLLGIAMPLAMADLDPDWTALSLSVGNTELRVNALIDLTTSNPAEYRFEGETAKCNVYATAERLQPVTYYPWFYVAPFALAFDLRAHETQYWLRSRQRVEIYPNTNIVPLRWDDKFYAVELEFEGRSPGVNGYIRNVVIQCTDQESAARGSAYSRESIERLTIGQISNAIGGRLQWIFSPEPIDLSRDVSRIEEIRRNTPRSNSF